MSITMTTPLGTPYRNKDSVSDVSIKAVEIQSATHQEIINVGNNVFEKNNKRQMEQFHSTLQEQQNKLMKRLEEEKKMALDELKDEHQLSINKLQQHYIDMMDSALKEEADRLHDIMDRIATTSLEEEKLEGQRKLDDSLKKARVDFDNEKSEAIIKVTLEHEEMQKQKEKQLEAVHDANIGKLNLEWNEKMKIQNEKAVLHENETLEHELEMLKKNFEIRLEEALLESDRKHAEEVNKLNKCIEDEKVCGTSLQNKMILLSTSIDTMKKDLKNILHAFQSFIDTTPGFSPGQSEFVLNHLLPGGFDEFISSSD